MQQSKSVFAVLRENSFYFISEASKVVAFYDFPNAYKIQIIGNRGIPFCIPIFYLAKTYCIHPAITFLIIHLIMIVGMVRTYLQW